MTAEVRELDVPAAAPADVAAALGADVLVDTARWSLAGCETVGTLTARAGRVAWQGHLPLPPADDLTTAIRSALELAAIDGIADLPVVPGLVGALGFDAFTVGGSTADLDAALLLPRLSVVWDHVARRAWTVALSVDGEDPDHRHAEIAAVTPRQPPAFPPASLDPTPHPGDDEYQRLLAEALRRVRAGEAGQVTIARDYTAPCDVDDVTLHAAVRALNPAPYTFRLRLPGVTLVGASPLGLLTVRDGAAVTRVIAGTRPRGADAEQDAERERALFADPKERGEHAMLVELAADDLAPVAHDVTLTRDAEPVHTASVIHLITELRAGLHADAVAALRRVFPPSTVTGTPRAAATAIIADLEPQPRGLYGGAVAVFGLDGSLDACLGIRTLHLVGGVAHVPAGAGVVAASDPAAEVRESRDKSAAAFAALAAANAVRAGRGTVAR